MKNLKMECYMGYDGKFDQNRNVIMHVNAELKIVTVLLTGSYDEVVKKFKKAVGANGLRFRGYEFVAESPALLGTNLTISARVPQ